MFQPAPKVHSSQRLFHSSSGSKSNAQTRLLLPSLLLNLGTAANGTLVTYNVAEYIGGHSQWRCIGHGRHLITMAWLESRVAVESIFAAAE